MSGQLHSSKRTNNTEIGTQAGCSSSVSKNENGCFSVVREKLNQQGLSHEATAIILQSWRQSTKQQYEVYLKQWFQYCDRQQVNAITAPVESVLAFLSTLYKRNLKYSALNTARSAISQFMIVCGGADIGKHILVVKFMRGVFNKRPSLPKYNSLWDVSVIIRFLEQSPCVSLLMLSGKLCILFLLLTAQRCQTLHLVKLQDIIFSSESVTFKVPHLLKQSRPGHHLSDIVLRAYSQNEALCIVHTLKEYIERTKELRADVHQLLIGTQKPHKAVSKSTVARWIKLIMSKAGIDPKFGAHSTRAVATSTAKQRGVPLNVIAKTAGWSNARTFARFYDKPVHMQHGLASVILE